MSTITPPSAASAPPMPINRKNGVAKFDQAEILRTLDLILAPGDVIEVRALNAQSAGWKPPHTISGYFDDPAKLVKELPYIETATGVYITLNPIDPALLARYCNHFHDCKRDDPTTSNTDITATRWLPIDVDAVRPSGISSTDAQHIQALAIARRISTDLQQTFGLPAPIMGDSGNGGHLLWRVNLENGDRGLIQQALQALARHYDDALMKIDTSVYTPARIWKLYGTWARKGDSTPDRPHRMAHLLDVPDPLETVTKAQLQAIIAAYPPEIKPPPPGRMVANRNGARADFDLQQWLQTYLPDAEGPKDWQTETGKGRRWFLPTCPWNAEHTGGSAFIGEQGNGAIIAKCQHNSCQGHNWKELRALKEPGYAERSNEPRSWANIVVLPDWWDDEVSAVEYARQYAAEHYAEAHAEPDAGPPKIAEQVVTTSPLPKPTIAKTSDPHLYTAADALAPQPPVDWVIDGLLAAASTAVFFGQPGCKKTWSCLDLAVCVAQGTRWLDAFAVKQGTVLLVDEESGPRRLLKRMGEAIRGHRGDDGLPIFATSLHGFNFWAVNSPDAGGKVLRDLILQVQARLVVIDALADVMLGGDENMVRDAQPVFHTLRKIAEQTGATIIVIHHATKANGGGYRGSTAIAGAVDLLLEVVSKAGEHGVTFATIKARDSEPQKFAGLCHWQSDEFWISAGTIAEKGTVVRIYTKAERAVLAYLKKHNDQGTIAEIQLGVVVCAPRTAKDAIYKLGGDGILKRIDEGKHGQPATYAIDQETFARFPLVS